MSNSTTRESLGIVWKGEEVDGFTIHGYWPRAAVHCPRLSFDGWPDADHQTAKLFGNNWTVWLWDVNVRTWPNGDHWRQLVADLLQ
jgi:hypothetical protein